MHAAQLAFAFASSPALTSIHGRFRRHSRSLPHAFGRSLSPAEWLVFASSPACFRFRFRKQSSLLSLSLASSPGHFRKQPSSLSQAAFAFASSHGRFRLQISSLSLSLAPTVAFASTHGCFRTSSPARFCFRKHSRSLLQAAPFAFISRFHPHSRSLSQSAYFRKQPSSLSLSQAFAAAFATTSGRSRKHPQALSQAAQLAFAVASIRGRFWIRRPRSLRVADSSRSLCR